MKTKTSIHALIQLLDDPNVEVMEHAKRVLLNYGDEIIPELEKIEDASLRDPVQMENVASILKALRFQRVKNLLSEWINDDEKDLMKAVYAINAYQFPDLNIQDFVMKFQDLKHSCWREMNPKQTSFEKIEVLNKVFFKKFEFTRVQRGYSSPFEIYLDSVLDTKEGTDLSIALIYSLIAQSLDLPVYCVVSSNHRTPIVLSYLDQTGLLPILNWGIHNNGVLFYILIQEKGLIIDPSNLKEKYNQEGLSEHKSQFEPSPNTLIIKRYLTDLRNSYANYAHLRHKMKDIEDLLILF